MAHIDIFMMCLLTYQKYITVESFILTEVININLIEGLLDIIKDDTRHIIKICFDTLGVIVYLDDDPDKEYEEKYVIPVRYDSLYESAYIPHDEYLECMSKDVDGGIDKEEIDLIQKIMEYLENNKKEIDHYCNLLDPETRKKNNSDLSDTNLATQTLTF